MCQQQSALSVIPDFLGPFCIFHEFFPAGEMLFPFDPMVFVDKGILSRIFLTFHCKVSLAPGTSLLIDLNPAGAFQAQLPGKRLDCRALMTDSSHPHRRSITSPGYKREDRMRVTVTGKNFHFCEEIARSEI